jgi:hypothetical protein
MRTDSADFFTTTYQARFEAGVEDNLRKGRIVTWDVRVSQSRHRPVAVVALVAEYPPGIEVPQILEAFLIPRRRVIEIGESRTVCSFDTRACSSIRPRRTG